MNVRTRCLTDYIYFLPLFIKTNRMDLYVGSLPFKMKEQQLRELFEKYGEVSSVKIIIDKITRQNKGFGFVEMPNDEEAMKAIHELNGTEVMERPIIVTKSEEKKDTPKRSSFSSSNFSKGSNPFLKGGGFGGNAGGKSGYKGGGGFNRGTFKGGSKRGS
jgi:RNA recognition motif-containing protein